ncbi:putative acyl-protein thioesterase [Colletotrichum sublineola]|uniref:Putative acyl-protein thioesterase n=1 Tax=Colletotrichum sublineola TaxID=1173701 RepID=A0A066XWF3_COLSU|nr:putative acyl-protein thioesterase [Colletotrichum sublineola]
MLDTANVTDETRLPLHVFPSPTVIPPLKQPHLHSLIFLHGRGSSARVFAPPFLSAPVRGPNSSILTLREALPHTRFTFPTAPRSRATLYKRSIINQWYDGSGDWEETALGNARETVSFVHALIREEAQIVGGADRVFLGGFSQGCAAALLCSLLWEGEPLGGILGMCGMLPMANAIESVLRERSHATNDEYQEEAPVDSDDDVFESFNHQSPFSPKEDEPETNPLEQALMIIREEIDLPSHPSKSVLPFQKTPVLLGHGSEDDRVLPQHSQQACRILRLMGCNVNLRIYSELDHWYSEDMLQDMVEAFGGKTTDLKGH